MARIRTIKPEFFTSEDIVSLSPMARLLYIALWCESDREGRMQWKPRTFKMRYFPADTCDIDALCDELESAELVRLYGDGFAYIPKFGTHQHLNPREAASSLPNPHASARVIDASARVKAPLVTRREEGKGKEGDTRVDDATAFETFWAAYPRKTAKANAAKAFARTRPDEATLRAMLAAIAVQRISPQWTRDGGQFIPHAASWLNGRRWEDSDEKPAELDRFAGAL